MKGGERKGGAWEQLGIEDVLMGIGGWIRGKDGLDIQVQYLSLREK